MGCHRLPDRCFKINGEPMVICSRCFGILVAHVLVLIPLVLLKPSISYIPLGITLILPAFIDGISQFKYKRESNNILRFITGVIGGIGYLLILFFIITYPIIMLFQLIGFKVLNY